MPILIGRILVAIFCQLDILCTPVLTVKVLPTQLFTNKPHSLLPQLKQFLSTNPEESKAPHFLNATGSLPKISYNGV